MDREVPRTTSDEIRLYIRTYYSMLRSSGDVWVRAFEEAHAYSDSSLHAGARAAEPDVAAFAYSAARLPAEMHLVERLVLGQSHEQFEAAGLDVRRWNRVRARGRRRPLRWDGDGQLAVIVTSTSDIDDLVPMVTSYQIEWNKLNGLLAGSALGSRLAAARPGHELEPDLAELGATLRLDASGVETLRHALGESWKAGLAAIARRPSDLRMRLLSGTMSQYQTAAHRWWSGIEPGYLREARPRRRPVYFVSSNTHAIPNLLAGWGRAHMDGLVAFARQSNPEGLGDALDAALARGDSHEVASIGYYLSGAYLKAGGPERIAEVQAWDAEHGIKTFESPGHIDVTAQLCELRALDPARLDDRVRVPGIEALRSSDAVIVNIDYPLGLAAYYHLARVAQGVGDIRGIYVMGKAATLNGRVGDVMISGVAHDEHSQNTYLFKNCFSAANVQPWVRQGTVLDNQKALTVRSAFLQNRDYMGVFYKEGYTVLEMETGPYLSAIYEIVNPNRHPQDEIVHLSNQTPFDVGILHYASDTPYSRRQSLLSKSLSYFGVESTYGCALAIVRRIFSQEIARLQG
jgi:hypothetical protein